MARASQRHVSVRRWARARRDPGVATGLALTLAAAVAIGGVATLGLVAYLVRQNDALRRLDANAAQWGHDHATDGSQTAIEIVTQLGETWLVAIAGLLLPQISYA